MGYRDSRLAINATDSALKPPLPTHTREMCGYTSTSYSVSYEDSSQLTQNVAETHGRGHRQSLQLHRGPAQRLSFENERIYDTTRGNKRETERRWAHDIKGSYH